MKSVELSEYIVNFIEAFDTPYSALQAVIETPAPYKSRRAKKLLCKRFIFCISFYNWISKAFYSLFTFFRFGSVLVLIININTENLLILPIFSLRTALKYCRSISDTDNIRCSSSLRVRFTGFEAERRGFITDMSL